MSLTCCVKVMYVFHLLCEDDVFHLLCEGDVCLSLAV